MAKSNVGKKGFLSAYTPRKLSITEGGQGTGVGWGARNSNMGGTHRQELRHKGHGRGLLTDLLSTAGSASFLVNARTSSPGMAPLLMQPSHVNHSLRKYSTYLVFSQFRFPLPRHVCVCVKLTKTKENLTSTPVLIQAITLDLHLSSGIPGPAWTPPLNTEQ